MKTGIEFILVLIVVFLVNYLINRLQSKKMKDNEYQMELLYLMRIYRFDFKSINKKKFMLVSSFINALIISVVYIIIIYLVKGFIWQILIGLVLAILLIVIFYGLLGRYYEKKGRR